MKLTRLRKLIKLTRHSTFPKNTKGSRFPFPEINTIVVIFSEKSNLANPQDNYSKTSIIDISKGLKEDVNKALNADSENINN